MAIKTFLAAAVNIWQASSKLLISHATLVPLKLQPKILYQFHRIDYFSRFNSDVCGDIEVIIELRTGFLPLHICQFLIHSTM